jgi:hypothetical protein
VPPLPSNVHIDSHFDTDLAEMHTAGLVTKRLDQVVEREGLIDDRLHVIGIQSADHLDLLLAASDLQALNPNLSGQQRHGRNRTGKTRQDADERDISTDATRADRLR